MYNDLNYLDFYSSLLQTPQIPLSFAAILPEWLI